MVTKQTQSAIQDLSAVEENDDKDEPALDSERQLIFEHENETESPQKT